MQYKEIIQQRNYNLLLNACISESEKEIENAKILKSENLKKIKKNIRARLYDELKKSSHFLGFIDEKSKYPNGEYLLFDHIAQYLFSALMGVQLAANYPGKYQEEKIFFYNSDKNSHLDTLIDELNLLEIVKDCKLSIVKDYDKHLGPGIKLFYNRDSM